MRGEMKRKSVKKLLKSIIKVNETILEIHKKSLNDESLSPARRSLAEGAFLARSSFQDDLNKIKRSIW